MSAGEGRGRAQVFVRETTETKRRDATRHDDDGTKTRDPPPQNQKKQNSPAPRRSWCFSG